MILSKERLLNLSENTEFRPEILEKVLHLMNLLNQFNLDKFLSSRIVLNGGTALNLCYLDCPRLSVDIDINYIGSLEEVSLDHIQFDQNELVQMLIPMLTSKELALVRQNANSRVKKIVTETRDKLSTLLSFRENEIIFLNKLLDQGEIVPELITNDPILIEKIAAHPGLKWKAQNVKDYKI